MVVTVFKVPRIHDPFNWYFDVSYGYQDSTNGSFNFAGLAIRSGEVTIATIPESSTILLLGPGLIEALGIRRDKQYF